MSKPPMVIIQELAEELEAILLLEYHNLNHLARGTDPKQLNKDKRYLVRRIKHVAGVNEGD